MFEFWVVYGVAVVLNIIVLGGVIAYDVKNKGLEFTLFDLILVLCYIFVPMLNIVMFFIAVYQILKVTGDIVLIKGKK